MDYIDELNNGQFIANVFTTARKTQYRDLYIVSARKKEVLMHYSKEKVLFLSEWFDHIDDFDNFIYTKVYLGSKYNYIYPTGKPVSPYWSDVMSQMGQTLWPISFNGKYNFIKEDGSLLLQEFADGICADDGSNSLVIGYLSSNPNLRGNEYYRLSCDGSMKILGTKYVYMPDIDVYSSKSNLLSDRIFLHRRIFWLSVEDSNGKELVSDVLGIAKYKVRPISDFEGVSEGYQGTLFSVRKEKFAGGEVLLLFYDFATIKSANGYRVLCFSTDSILPDTFEEVQVLRALFIKVRKDGTWNLIDKYGDYVSKNMWFDSIELMNNGNAVVKKGMQYNFLKSNGTLSSSEWYDEITPASEAGKFVVRRGSAYNVIDNNLRFISRKWQDSTEGFPCFPQKATAPNLTVRKSWSNIRLYDPVWLNYGGDIVECYVLSYSGRKLTILWPLGDTVVKDMTIEMSYDNNEESVRMPCGWLYLNKP